LTTGDFKFASLSILVGATILAIVDEDFRPVGDRIPTFGILGVLRGYIGADSLPLSFALRVIG